MKNCVFQYATVDGQIFENTDLITADQAQELWDRYVPKFKEHMEAGRSPEMAIWVDMDDRYSFRTTSKHWCGTDMELRDGELFQLARVG